jgi:hypothetical protein
VQTAREAARRSQCRNNLKQIALAEHNYADIHGMFTPALVMVKDTCWCGLRPSVPNPPPTGCGTPGCHVDPNLHTWGEFLLPFLEANAVYNRIDFNQPNFAPVNWTFMGPQWNYTARNSGILDCDPCAAKRPTAAPIPAFVCPSAVRVQNPFVEEISVMTDPDVIPYATLNRLRGANDYTALNGPADGLVNFYVSITGTMPPRLNTILTSPICTPVFFSGVLNPRNPSPTIAGITDGTSTTLLCVEYAGKPGLWIRGVKQNLVHPPMIDSQTKGQFTDSNPGGCWACFENAYNNVLGTTFDGLAMTPRIPAAAAPTCFFNCTNEYLMNAVYSFHPGAGGVALCDGSARMLSEDISAVVFVRMITFAGREPLSDSAF